MNLSAKQIATLCLTATILNGCTMAGMLGGGTQPQAAQSSRIPVGNELALPPDLALKSPTQTVDAYQPNGPVAQLPEASAPRVASANLYGDAPAPTPGTLDATLARYGISKTRPDGKPKSSAEINDELKTAMTAEKRRANPNYGTIFNIGNIFSGG